FQKETHPYYNLTVKILKARNIHGLDLLSKANCYVAVDLPTASPLTSRTHLVYNCSDPEWNEAFNYKIHNAVKNIVEFTFYDANVVLRSHAASITFDVANIAPGQTFNHTFVLSHQVSIFAWFLNILSKERLLLSGIVCYSFLCLVLHPSLRLNLSENCQVHLSLPGSFERWSSTSCSAESEEKRKIPFVFHVDRETHPKLLLDLLQTTPVIEEGWSEDLKMHTEHLGMASIPVSTLPQGQELEFSVLVGKDVMPCYAPPAFFLEHSFEDLDVRLGFNLCRGEQQFLLRRKERSSRALKKILKLSKAPLRSEVPTVAVVSSGGGVRAMTAFYGHLLGLQELSLLDTLTYVCGISGSTWCLCKLYEDPHWSHKDLQEAVSIARQFVTSSKARAFSAEQLVYYFQQLWLLEKEGQNVTLTDLWGLIIEYFLHQKENPRTLSDQQAAVRWGQNPYPIYAAINVKPNVDSSMFAEWCEFTPYEFGIRKYGAFIRSEDFGSKFFMGLLREKRPEPRVSFLQGIWSSAFAANLEEIWKEVVSSKVGFIESLKAAIESLHEIHGHQYPDTSHFETRMVMPEGAISSLFQDFSKYRFSSGENVNYMRGLYLHKDYLKNKEFVAWKGTQLDALPNHLTPMEDNLYLIDGNFSINSPFPLVLHQERDVDVILSFNYSWEAPFEVLYKTEKYCEERDIPFPHIAVSEEDKQNPKECYMFIDAENPKAPIVLHFPLVNNTFQKCKAPGVVRETEEEKSSGNFAVDGKTSPYYTMNFTYEPVEFDQLLELCRYNIMNNKDVIFKALALGLKRKAEKNKGE
ncbi:PA24F phospholipase, partial [Nothoprocta pentlandii]|nr:PA24F phospholipase [Nothoprocta pentlandii]